MIESLMRCLWHVWPRSLSYCTHGACCMVRDSRRRGWCRKYAVRAYMCTQQDTCVLQRHAASVDCWYIEHAHSATRMMKACVQRACPTRYATHGSPLPVYAGARCTSVLTHSSDTGCSFSRCPLHDTQRRPGDMTAAKEEEKPSRLQEWIMSRTVGARGPTAQKQWFCVGERGEEEREIKQSGEV